MFNVETDVTCDHVILSTCNNWAIRLGDTIQYFSLDGLFQGFDRFDAKHVWKVFENSGHNGLRYSFKLANEKRLKVVYNQFVEDTNDDDVDWEDDDDF